MRIIATINLSHIREGWGKVEIGHQSAKPLFWERTSRKRSGHVGEKGDRKGPHPSTSSTPASTMNGPGQPPRSLSRGGGRVDVEWGPLRSPSGQIMRIDGKSDQRPNLYLASKFPPRSISIQIRPYTSTSLAGCWITCEEREKEHYRLEPATAQPACPVQLTVQWKCRDKGGWEEGPGPCACPSWQPDSSQRAGAS